MGAGRGAQIRLAKWLSDGIISRRSPDNYTCRARGRIGQARRGRVGRQRLHQMRICLYTCTALPKLGGQEAVVDALARQFLKLGHEPVVLAPRPRSWAGPADAQLPYPVCRHPRFVSTRHFVSWYGRFLLSAHAKYRFDVVHCHDIYPSGYVAALCKTKLGVPLVITSHGGDVREGNVRITKPGVRQRHVLAVRAADALVSIGRFTEEGFRRLYPEAPRIVTIPNGIDLEPFQSRAARPTDLDLAIRENRYALFLGRLSRRKGVDVLLRAMAQIPSAQGAQLVIAGSGEEQAALESLAKNLEVADRVRFIGRVEGQEKVYLLQNSLFTVMPSRTWEAFPLVVLESYAAGKPMVGTAIAGIADLIEEGKTGTLVPEEDPAALARAMRELFENPDRARAMGEFAATITRRYSWDSIAARHIALYEGLQARATCAAREV